MVDGWPTLNPGPPFFFVPVSEFFSSLILELGGENVESSKKPGLQPPPCYPPF
jgi:hypothetical protein